MKEFNLSDKIFPLNLDKRGFKIMDCVDVTDVKEFIRRLKEMIERHDTQHYDNEMVLKFIDKLAGDKLK